MKRRSVREVIEIQTARCASCRIFTATSEMIFSGDGLTYCTRCGAPKENQKRVEIEWAIPIRASRIDGGVRIVAGTIALVLVVFWIAACASQI